MHKQSLSTGQGLVYGLFATLTMLQIGASGILFYFMINEWLAGEPSMSLTIWIALLLIVLVDLFLVYWLVRLVDLLAENAEH